MTDKTCTIAAQLAPDVPAAAPASHGTLPYQGARIVDAMVTTALELPGHRIVRNIGLVRGIVVRSRSLFGTIGAGFQTLSGGKHFPLDLYVRTRPPGFV